MKAGSLFTAHKTRRDLSHRKATRIAPIESVTRHVETRDVQMIMKGNVPRLRMAAKDRTVALSLPRVKWMERAR
ncbi:MAG: hypothetical protein Q8M31_00900 [Beijerinckiaceae bacterium]|nr:hypothetical protein [Beijerinckiaceae bacterium]